MTVHDIEVCLYSCRECETIRVHGAKADTVILQCKVCDAPTIFDPVYLRLFPTGQSQFRMKIHA